MGKNFKWFLVESKKPGEEKKIETIPAEEYGTALYKAAELLSKFPEYLYIAVLGEAVVQ